MLATCAAIHAFVPVTSTVGLVEQTYVGPSLGANNPTSTLISEAHMLYGANVKVSSILSIGSGHPGNLAMPESRNTATLNNLYWKMLSDSEVAAEEIQTRLKDTDILFRFSVRHGMQSNQPAYHDVVSAVTAQTKNYLDDAETKDAVSNYVETLVNANGWITLDNLSASCFLKQLAADSAYRIRWCTAAISPPRSCMRSALCSS